MSKIGPSQKEHIHSQLAEDLWDVPTMSAVVEAKKIARNKKGKLANMFVIKSDGNKGNELQKFLANLQENLADIPDGTRMQVAIQSMDHWVPIDIQIKDGQVNAILMEAAPSPMTSSILNQIQAKFPGGDVYAFVPDAVDIGGRERNRFIQFDDNSCSRFSLEHMFHMANMDNIYDILQENQEAMPPHSKYPMSEKPYFEFTPENAPKELAFMFRDTQSLGVISSLSEELQSQVINSKGETFVGRQCRLPVRDK